MVVEPTITSDVAAAGVTLIPVLPLMEPKDWSFAIRLRDPTLFTATPVKVKTPASGPVNAWADGIVEPPESTVRATVPV